MGLVKFLASKTSVPTKSADPEFADAAGAVVAEHAPLDVKLYYAIRMLSQFVRSDSTLSMDERMTKLLGGADLGAHPKLNIRPRNANEFTEVWSARFPTSGDWRTHDPRTNKASPLAPNSGDVLGRIGRTSNKFRNHYLNELIKRELSGSKRVLVVTGVAHLATLLPVLRAIE
jgi:hypothetical protein